MRAARIENGLVVDLWEVPSLDCYGPDVALVEAPGDVLLGATYSAKDGFKNPKVEKNQATINAEARAYLVATDWFLIREAETGEPIPKDVATKRGEARKSIVD